MTGSMPYFMMPQPPMPPQQQAMPSFDISSIIQMLMPMLMQLMTMLRQPPASPPPIAVGLPPMIDPDPEVVPPDDEELVPPDDEELIPPDDEVLIPPDDEELLPPDEPIQTPAPTPAGPNPNDGDGLEVDIDDAANNVNLRRWTRDSNTSASIGSGNQTQQDLQTNSTRTFDAGATFQAYGEAYRNVFTQLKNNLPKLDFNNNNTLDLYELTWLANRSEDPNFIENSDFANLDSATRPPAAPSSVFAYFNPVGLSDSTTNIGFTGPNNAATSTGLSGITMDDIRTKRSLFKSRTQPNEFNPAFSDYFNEPLKNLYVGMDRLFFNLGQQFNKVDRNGDGKIDADELNRLASRTGDARQIEMSDFVNLT